MKSFSMDKEEDEKKYKLTTEERRNNRRRSEKATKEVRDEVHITLDEEEENISFIGSK